jgi:hypothetical protein
MTWKSLWRLATELSHWEGCLNCLFAAHVSARIVAASSKLGKGHGEVKGGLPGTLRLIKSQPFAPEAMKLVSHQRSGDQP